MKNNIEFNRILFHHNKSKYLNALNHLLGGLLLLLGFSLVFLSRGSFFNWGRCFLLLLLFLLGNKESKDLLGLDHVVLINVELTEDVLNFILGHLVSPGLESVLEHLDVHLALNVVGLEGLDDE